MLINNAGIHSPDFKRSGDGYELTFAVNQLAPFLLTLLLLDKLKASQPARIITVTSIAHHVREPNLERINDPATYHGWGAYKLSKFANVLFTYALAQKLEGSGVTANCLHPGTVDTKVLHSAFPDMQGISLEEGARVLLSIWHRLMKWRNGAENTLKRANPSRVPSRLMIRRYNKPCGKNVKKWSLIKWNKKSP